MVPILSLWLPILLSAVFVFILSSIIHMVLKYHQSDWGKLADEDKIMEDLRKYDLHPGQYMLPCGEGPQDMKNPDFIKKMEDGPVALLTVMESGPPKMGKELALWFVYSVVIGILAAYVTGRALGPGAEYLSVFRFVGVTTFIAYTVAGWSNSIWYKQKWSTTCKNTFDGLIYAIFTAGTFGWLWPQ